MDTARPLRVWPVIALVVLMCFLRFVLPALLPAAAGVGFFGSLILWLVLLVWLLFFSRAAWGDRLVLTVLMFVSLFLSKLLVHDSIGTSAFGMTYLTMAVPLVSLAVLVWTLLCASWQPFVRRIAGALLIIVFPMVLTVLRTDGVTSSFEQEFAWRWSLNAEEQLIAQQQALSSASGDVLLWKQDAADLWSGFRGNKRDGIIEHDQLRIDQPLQERWRQPIGPGWSSFAAKGDVFFTQEQRGEEEQVNCYRIDNGALVWSHSDAVRFWESMAGAGPRATPVIFNDLIVSFGATGILNVLDAKTGVVHWSHDVAKTLGAKTPYWGFSASPAVLGDHLYVAASGSLAAYEVMSGRLLWKKVTAAESYSSPQICEIHGVRQLLFAHNQALQSFDLLTGDVLWSYKSEGECIVQPHVLASGAVLFGNSSGFRSLQVSTADSIAWDVKEQWTAESYIPDFNDFVVHGEHVYGFSGNMLASVRLSDGALNWEGDACGGQLVLLKSQGMLLVLAEDGQLLYVKAQPQSYELVKRETVLHSKTWNHPSLIGDTWLFRNDKEIAAYRMPLQ